MYRVTTMKTTKTGSCDDATQDDTLQGLSDRCSPLGRYYSWLLCDPTHKDYWATRSQDRVNGTRHTDTEKS